MDSDQIARLVKLTPTFLGQRLSSKTNVFVSPAIPIKKLTAARRSYIDRPDGELVLVLYDETVFGSAKIGFAVTDTALVYNLPASASNPARLKAAFQLRDINTIEFKKNDFTCDVVVNGVHTCNAASLNTRDALALQQLFERALSADDA